MDNTSLIDTSNIPQHIAIIMDGNGRWAKEQGLDRVIGHKEGVNSVRKVVEAATETGVKFLTLYAFSTENWNRPKEEVDALMELLVSALRMEVDSLKNNNIQLRVIGNIPSLPVRCQHQLNESIEILKDNTGLVLVLALSYSSRWEIVHMVQQIATAVKNGSIETTQITDEMVRQFLCTSHIPDPELLIRTGGEERVSNFLLYQIAYSELYFTETQWPAFGKEDLLKAIADYQSRERRFGKTSEQIQNKAKHN